MLAYNNTKQGLISHERSNILAVVRYRIGAMFLLLFSIPYKEWVPFGTSYLNFSFICFFIYLIFSIATFRFSFRSKDIWPYVAPFLLLLILFWTMSSINYYPRSVMAHSENRRFIMCFLMYVFLINEIKARPALADQALAVFLYSLMILTVGYFLGIGVRTGNLGRTSFSGINSNRLGLWYVMGLFIIIKLVVEGKVNKLQMYLMTIFSVLFLYIIAKTASRSGFGALIMGPACYLYFLNIPLKRKIPIALAGIIVIAGIGGYVLSTSSLLADRLAEVSGGDIGERQHIWETALVLVKDNLIFGSGASGYEFHMSQFFSGYEAPHNVYLLVLSYTGLVGLAIFLVFLYRWGMAAYRINQVYRSPFYISIFLVFLVYLFTAGGVLESFHFWMIAGITVGYHCSYAANPAKAPILKKGL